MLRRTLRTEVALLAVVLGVTAALTSYPPPDSLAAGPFSTTTDLGAARIELTVDPARGGLQRDPPLSHRRAHRRPVRPLPRAGRLDGPPLRKEVGPLEPRIDKAGPGHWVARRAQFAPAGDWRLAVSRWCRSSRSARTLVEVPVGDRLRRA